MQIILDTEKWKEYSQAVDAHNDAEEQNVFDMLKDTAIKSESVPAKMAREAKARFDDYIERHGEVETDFIYRRLRMEYIATLDALLMDSDDKRMRRVEKTIENFFAWSCGDLLLMPEKS